MDVKSNVFYNVKKENRIELAQTVAEYFCEENDISYIEFKPDKLDSKTTGMYDYKENAIILNNHFFEDTDNSFVSGQHLGCVLLENIIHEYEHYNQYCIHKNLPDSEIYQELMIPISDDSIFYDLQLTEQDANNIAIKWMEEANKICKSKNLQQHVSWLKNSYYKFIETQKLRLYDQNYIKDNDEIINCIKQLRPYYEVFNQIADAGFDNEYEYDFHKYKLTVKENKIGSTIEIESKDKLDILFANMNENRCIICNLVGTQINEILGKTFYEDIPMEDENIKNIIYILKQYANESNKCELSNIDHIELIPIDILYDKDSHIKIINTYDGIKIKNNILESLNNFPENLILRKQIMNNKNIKLQSLDEKIKQNMIQNDDKIKEKDMNIEK